MDKKTAMPSPLAGPLEEPSFRIFDRDHAAHPWRRAFAEIASVSTPDRRWAVASNWIMDHRVSPDRESLDLMASGHFVPDGDAETWWSNRYLYFVEEVCRPWSSSAEGRMSAYLRPPNRSNRITERVAPFDQLVHIGCLSSILRRVSRGERAASVEIALRRLAGRGLPFRLPGGDGFFGFNQQVEVLARSLLRAGEEAVRQAAGLLVDALGDGEPPWWACFAQEIEASIASSQAASLRSALGLGHLSAGQWLIVWRYRVDQVAPLYRPTVAEANDSPYHYPSPPGYGFGITMPLEPSMPACREVVHRPLRGTAAVEACTGQLLRLEAAPLLTDNELASLRNRHRERLREEFPGDGLHIWLERYPVLP